MVVVRKICVIVQYIWRRGVLESVEMVSYLQM